MTYEVFEKLLDYRRHKHDDFATTYISTRWDEARHVPQAYYDWMDETVWARNPHRVWDDYSSDWILDGRAQKPIVFKAAKKQQIEEEFDISDYI